MLLSNLLCQILFLPGENLASVTYCDCQIRCHNVLDMGLRFTSIWKLQLIQDLADYLLSSVFSLSILKQPWTTCSLFTGLWADFSNAGDLRVWFILPFSFKAYLFEWATLLKNRLLCLQTVKPVSWDLTSEREWAVHTWSFRQLWSLRSSFIMFSMGPNKSQILKITCVSRNRE